MPKDELNPAGGGPDAATGNRHESEAQASADSNNAPEHGESMGASTTRNVPESTESMGAATPRSQEPPSRERSTTRKTSAGSTNESPAIKTDQFTNQGVINVLLGRESSSQGAGQEEASLRNPTREFQFDPERTLLVEDGIVSASRLLRENAMLAIVSDQPEIALSAAKHVIDHHVGGHSRSLLCYNRRDADIECKGNANDKTQSGSQADYYSFQTLSVSLDVIPEDATVLVNLTAERQLDDARAFMAIFLARDTIKAFFDEFSLLLAKRRQQLIFLLPELVGADLALRGHLQVWRLDAIRILLAQECRETLDDTLAEVRRQIKQGLWGEDPARQLLRARADKSLHRRIKEFRDYSEADQRKDQQAFVAILHREAQYRPINEVVLFVGVWFRELAEPHFERVVEALLGDETMEAPSTAAPPSNKTQDGSSLFQSAPTSNQPSPIINVYASAAPPDHQATLNPNDLLTQTPARIALTELWRGRVRTEVVRDCRISLQTGIDGRKYFAFAEPHLAATARSALESEAPFHFNAYFPRILQAGLVFDRSLQIADSALHLIREGMRRASDEYDWRWLGAGIIGGLATHDLLDTENSSSFTELMRDFMIKVQERDFVMSRWTKLLQLLLDDERLAKVAKELLGNLIDLGQHVEVLDLVRRLRTSLGLDTIHWLKRLIAQGPPDVRCQAIGYLQVYVQTSAAQTPELVSMLRGWLPSNRDGRVRTTPLHAAAIWTPLLISVVALQRQDLAATIRPSLFPILADQKLPDLPATFAETLELILYPMRSGAPSNTLTEVGKLLSEGLLVQIPGVRSLLDDLGEVLSGGIVGEVPTDDGSELAPVLVLVLNQLRESAADASGGEPPNVEWDFSALLQLLVTAWFWILNDAADAKTIDATREKVAEVIVERLTPDQLQVMRSISNDARDLVNRIADDAGRPLRSHLLRFTSTSRSVNNALYAARKRRQSSTRG